MEGDLLHPEKGPGDVHFFDVAEVEAVFARNRAANRAPVASDGEIAADVFTLLDDGVNPVDVVKRTRIAPDVVEHLQTQWARMRQALLLPSEIRARVEAVLLGEEDAPSDGWAFKTARDLETAIAKAVAPTECASCDKNVASLCRACAKEYVARLAKQGE
jgi:hypothetical protein